MSALDDVLTAFAALVRDYETTEVDPGPGEGNFRCVDCHACYGCRFCVSCHKCEECTYCEGCVECTRCTQSKDARACDECTHIDHCRDCVHCHYVTLSVGCEDCVQCFACVGLSGEEFCILNERHSRRSYLERVSELRAELEQRRQRDGFRPAIDEPAGEEVHADKTSEAVVGPVPGEPTPGAASLSETAEGEAPDITATTAVHPRRAPSLIRGVRPGPRPAGSRAAPRSSSLVAGRRPERPGSSPGDTSDPGNKGV